MFLEIPLVLALSTIWARSFIIIVINNIIITIIIGVVTMVITTVIVSTAGGADSPGQAGEWGATGAYGGEGGEEGGADLTSQIYESNKYQWKYISTSTRSFLFYDEYICAAGAEGVPDLIWKRDTLIYTGFSVCPQFSICTGFNLKFKLKLNAFAEILTGSLANWMFPRENPTSQFCPGFIVFCNILRPPQSWHKDWLTITGEPSWAVFVKHQ